MGTLIYILSPLLKENLFGLLFFDMRAIKLQAIYVFSNNNNLTLKEKKKTPEQKVGKENFICVCLFCRHRYRHGMTLQIKTNNRKKKSIIIMKKKKTVVLKERKKHTYMG